MLRLNFRSMKGDAPTLTVAAFFRFYADGTLRGPENYLVARCVDGCWQLSGRMHRELDCEGPVKVRLSMGANQPPVLLGPFTHLRTAAGMLYGDDACLNVFVPGRNSGGAASCHELTLLPAPLSAIELQTLETTLVAKPNYQQAKRQKENARKARQQEKLARKQARPADGTEGVEGTEGVDGAEVVTATDVPQVDTPDLKIAP
jgi:hypothetical protein